MLTHTEQEHKVRAELQFELQEALGATDDR